MLTRQATPAISEDLLDKLLVALHPIAFTPESDKYHIGYYTAQQDFREVLENRLNAGPLPAIKTGEFLVTTLPTKRWWQVW